MAMHRSRVRQATPCRAAFLGVAMLLLSKLFVNSVVSHALVTVQPLMAGQASMVTRTSRAQAFSVQPKASPKLRMQAVDSTATEEEVEGFFDFFDELIDLANAMKRLKFTIDQLFPVLVARLPKLRKFGEGNVPASLLGASRDFPPPWPNARMNVIYGGNMSEYKVIWEKPLQYFKHVLATPWTLKDYLSGMKPRQDNKLVWTCARDPDKGRPFWTEKRPEPESLGNKRLLHVNGMALTAPLADQNCMDLARIFDCRVQCVFNPTRGFIADLFECGIGLVEDSESVEKLYDAPTNMTKTEIANMLKDDTVDHIQVIGYSQGTIIVTEALERLQKDPLLHEKFKDKLSVALFAHCGNASNWTKPYPKEVEVFRNEFDFVAELGVLPKDHDFKQFIRKDFWGHLLGEHYLPGFIYEEDGVNKSKYLDEEGNPSKLFQRIAKN